MKDHATLVSLFPLLITLLFAGCGSKGTGSAVSFPQVQAPIATAVSVSVATAAECANGGILVKTFLDLNANGSLDSSETVVTTLPVCNGAQGSGGAQGVGAGIQVSSAAPASCPAGGSILTAFMDVNNNGIKESGDSVTSISTICNGAAGTNGTNGSNGSNGTNGQSAYLTSTVASAAQCPAGGVVYSSHVGTAAPQIAIVCNGVNGSNGSNGSDGQDAVFKMGAVGKAVAGKNYSACHHDYLYIPDAVNVSRGWLVFRHQKNGSEDQGIGQTGFNTWNVDISNFNLSSEIGNVAYCQMTWNAVTQVLTYKVLDNSDGHGGETDSISM